MSNETAELLVKISATTELLRQQMIAAESTVEKSTRAMQRDLDKFDSKMSSAEKAGFKLGSGLRNVATSATAMFAALGVGTLVAVARESLDYAASLGETAQQLGVTTKLMQEFQFAAKQSGGTVEGANTALFKFSQTVGKALNNTPAAVKAFAALGISVEQLRKASDSERIELFADALAKIPDQAQQIAAGTTIMGKGFRDVSAALIGGSEPLKAYAAEARRLGLVLSDKQINDADKTADKIDALTTALKVKISSVVADNAASIGTLADAFGSLIDAAAKGLQALKNFDAFLDKAGGGDKYKVIGKLLSGDFSGANQSILDIGSGKTAKPAPAPAPKTGQSVVKPGATGTPFFPGQGNAGDFAKTPRGPLKGGIGGAFGAFGAALTIDVGAILAEAAAVEQIGVKARSSIPAVAGLTEELNKLGRAELERPAGVDFNGPSGADQLAALVDAADARRDIEFDASQQIAEDYRDRMNNATQFAAFQFETLFRGGVGDVWDNFQRIGEQVIAQVAAKLIASLVTGQSVGGLGSLFGGALKTVLGFADGGIPPVGRASMVGERGPELFVPRVPGTIITNDNLRGLGGGSPVSITVNAPGATAETEMLIRRTLAQYTPALINAAKRETIRDARRGRL